MKNFRVKMEDKTTLTCCDIVIIIREVFLTFCSSYLFNSFQVLLDMRWSISILETDRLSFLMVDYSGLVLLYMAG